MNGEELLNALQTTDRTREVKVCLQHEGTTYEILSIDEVATGRENDSIYICVERPDPEE